MKKILFFRTDRIGDFVLSCILIKSIKRNNPDSKVTVICSEKNFKYVQSLKLVDEAILYPNSLTKKVKFYFLILKREFDYALCLDGKKRSIFGCVISGAKHKIYSVTKKFYKYLFFFSKKNIFYFYDFNSRLDEFKSILNLLKFDFLETDMDVFNKEEINPNFQKSREMTPKSYNLLHIDEKWITESYRSKKGIRNFRPINANVDQLLNFAKDIIYKSNMNLVISSGEFNNNLIDKLKNKINEENENLTNKTLKILDNLSFYDLKFLIKNANLLITCHGSPSHVASAFKTKIIDIFDKKNESFYHFYTSHLRNYKYVYRDEFNVVSSKIISLI